MELFFLALVALIIIFSLGYYFYRPKKQQRTESIYTHALNAMVRGDTQTALQYLREVVKKDSDHVEAYLQMGDILREEGKALQAVKIHQSLTVRPNLTSQLQREIHKSLALDYKELGQLKKASREAELILKLDRKNIWANEFLLFAAEQLHDWEKAIQVAKTIQRLKQVQDPNQLSRFEVNQGMEKLERNGAGEAEKHFQKAIKMAPEYGLPFLRLGDLYADKRDLVKAIENWEKFALLSPGEGKKVFSKIESALFDLGRFSEVENFYQRILKKDGGDLDALAKLANVLEAKGDHHAALHLVEEALSRFNDSLQVRLMKLKLSVHVYRPHQLAQQIEEIIDLITSKSREK
ncbi:MAG: tetratricopeptide repeat protein [Fidelibacterota bacterium]